jgi:HD-GYP domain-containing protein (c-di-GMP phosphodiesterase class II)
MNETQVLLSRISALRQRLEQAAGLATEARAAAVALLETQEGLAERVAVGAEQAVWLDSAVRPVTGNGELEGGRPIPRRLSSRARRILDRGQGLLTRLRDLADNFAPEGGTPATPLAEFYKSTVSMIDTALRTVALMPDSITAQMHLSQGLEATLDVVSARSRTLMDEAARSGYEGDLVHRLAEALAVLAGGRPITLDPFARMADEVLADAGECGPLRFLEGDPQRPEHFTACHALTVARVAARVVRWEPSLREREPDVVLAALLHDAGMVQIPAGILARRGPLTEEEKRAVEGHCRRGAELIAPLAPDAPWLADAAEHHHERLDGTGYPDGLREPKLQPLTRFLAICDVYAALCSVRPYHPARATRTALADTLLLAEQGLLDTRCAECLLHLSFYPVGSVVELAQGSVGVVVATPVLGADLTAPSRPVVLVLTDPHGEPLPRPHPLDLARCQQHSIVRTLSLPERSRFYQRFPEWAA